MSKAREIDGPRLRKSKESHEQPLMHATLDARDWRTICRHWELYNAARPYSAQDERWRDAMPGLHRYVDQRTRGVSGDVTVPGTWPGYVYVTQWAASVSTMGAARDLADVMTRLVPQVVIGDPMRRTKTEGDD